MGQAIFLPATVTTQHISSPAACLPRKLRRKIVDRRRHGPTPFQLCPAFFFQNSPPEIFSTSLNANEGTHYHTNYHWPIRSGTPFTDFKEKEGSHCKKFTCAAPSVSSPAFRPPICRPSCCKALWRPSNGQPSYQWSIAEFFRTLPLHAFEGALQSWAATLSPLASNSPKAARRGSNQESTQDALEARHR